MFVIQARDARHEEAALARAVSEAPDAVVAGAVFFVSGVIADDRAQVADLES